MPNYDVQNVTGLTGTALTIAVLFGIVVFVIMLIAYTNVISRAGYSRWWILIMLVPVVNVIMLLVFCFKEWPTQRELRELRARVGGGYGSPYYQQGGQPQPGYPQSGYPQAGYPVGGYSQSGNPQQGYPVGYGPSSPEPGGYQPGGQPGGYPQ